MVLISVLSSDIAAIGFDVGTMMLRVKFISGRTVDFLNVPESTFTAFLSARSKEQFYLLHVKDCYQDRSTRETPVYRFGIAVAAQTATTVSDVGANEGTGTSAAVCA